MDNSSDFEILEFLPYLLNLAAEESSLEFQAVYKRQHGLLRTEWRVLFHLGRYGDLTATDIVRRARLHKTRVSRAVASLEQRRLVARRVDEGDRRVEHLTLTKAGTELFLDLRETAWRHDQKLAARFTPSEMAVLRSCLARLAKL